MSYRWMVFLNLFLLIFGIGSYGCKRVNPPSSEEVPIASPQPLPIQPKTIPYPAATSTPSSIPVTVPSSTPESAPGSW